MVTLITIVLNIEKMFGFYCFCSTKGKCSICLTSEKFKGKHYLLYQNCLDFKQDDKIVGNLLKVLKDLVSLNNHFVCGLINQKYYYATQNWFSGKKVVFSVEHCLEKWEMSLKHCEKASNKNYFKRKYNQLLSVNGFFTVMFEGFHN